MPEIFSQTLLPAVHTGWRHLHALLYAAQQQMGALEEALLLLFLAVLVSTLCRRIHLPVMLGYLLVGALVSPHALGLIGENSDAESLAEYGVVFLMFSIGLEFSLPRFLAMRGIVLGLGSAQVLGTMAVAMLGGSLFFDLPWRETLVLGSVFAMSSTAIVSKLLAERVEIDRPHGRYALGVLLFQDLAVVPLLIVLSALRQGNEAMGIPLLAAAFKLIVVMVLLIYVGPQLLRPWLRHIARAQSSEVFSLNVLLIVLGTAWITQASGLSMALGAFLAGMLLAETEYRHQVEEDIRPFRDLLLGLFFVTIGTQLDLRTIWHQPGAVFLLFIFLTLGKILITGILVRLLRDGSGTRVRSGVAVRTAILLGQGGEFGLVLLTFSLTQKLISPEFSQLCYAAILLSMLTAPLFISRAEYFVQRFIHSERRYANKQLARIASQTAALDQHILICGYGRSGQMVARLLTQAHILVHALDLDPDRVRGAATAGEQVSYGDATVPGVLEAAGLARARGVVVSYGHFDSALAVVHHVRGMRPNLPILVRTLTELDEAEVETLHRAGADEVVSYMQEGVLMLAAYTMAHIGMPLTRVMRQIQRVREDHYHLLHGYYHGASDDEMLEESQLTRLSPVTLNEDAAMLGVSLSQLARDLEPTGVTIQALRRTGRRRLWPRETSQLSAPEQQLQAGDVLVLQGGSAALEAAERLLLQGPKPSG